MAGTFQHRAFQFLAYQVGRLFPRKLDCALNVAPRCAVAAAVRGPVAVAQARPFEIDAPSRLAALSTHAVERSAP